MALGERQGVAVGRARPLVAAAAKTGRATTAGRCSGPSAVGLEAARRWRVATRLLIRAPNPMSRLTATASKARTEPADAA